MNLERRNNSDAPKLDDDHIVRGLVAPVYRPGHSGTQYELWDGAVERYAPGVFAEALDKSADVRCLFNHDPSLLLGRTVSGTLHLFENDNGLHYECVLDDTTVGRDVAQHLKRGDVSGSSARFYVTCAEWYTEDGVDVREIKSAELFDVSVVTFPAYTDTPTHLLETARTEHKLWKQTGCMDLALAQAQLQLWEWQDDTRNAKTLQPAGQAVQPKR